MNKYGRHGSRNFLVEDFIEDEFGLWATDEALGEQGCVDDEALCFWAWDNNEYAWRSRPFKIGNSRSKVEVKEKVKVHQQELEEHSLVKSKHMNQSCGLKKIVLGFPWEHEARKVSRMRAFGGWISHQPINLGDKQ